jgi:hypothetical protein
METPKQKADFLIDLFCDENYFSEKEILQNAKDNAKICVQQIINSWETNGTKLDLSIIDWWKKVLFEVENIKC